MKVILSRKGFDSQNGGQASPILPDGTMLSLPIPSSDDTLFTDIHHKGKTYLEIIKELKPSTKLDINSHCHLDPDLRQGCVDRMEGWMPAFGQTGAPLTELRNNGVGMGDIFLFFGWFRHTELWNGSLVYARHARNLHVIYGYMQVGRIIEKEKDIPSWLLSHPHANHNNYTDAWNNGLNAIFLPSERLSLIPGLPGSGTFRFNERLVLTKEGCSRSRWSFPQSMWGTEISHNPRGWKEDHFQSAAIGQEFVIDGTKPVLDWLMGLFDNAAKIQKK